MYCPPLSSVGSQCNLCVRQLSGTFPNKGKRGPNKSFERTTTAPRSVMPLAIQFTIFFPDKDLSVIIVLCWGMQQAASLGSSRLWPVSSAVRRTFRNMKRFVTVIFFSLILVSCSKKLDDIRIGMSENEALNKCGKPMMSGKIGDQYAPSFFKPPDLLRKDAYTKYYVCDAKWGEDLAMYVSQGKIVKIERAHYGINY